MIDALGIIETVGFAPAVQAADAAVKSANVKLGNWIKVGGGRVCIVMRGEVAAVKAAVDAGVTAAKAIGNVAGSLVIPRPSDKLTPQFPLEPLGSGKKGGK
jgi:microcompartment protein CcmL/EutN